MTATPTSPAVPTTIINLVTAVVPLSGSELVPIVQNGITKNVTTKQLIIPGQINNVVGGTGINVTSAGDTVTISNTGALSVANSDGTLNISPTVGNIIASLNLSHANTWIGTQSGMTAASGSNSTQFATTAYVDAKNPNMTQVTAPGAFTFTAPANTLASTVFDFWLTGAGGGGSNFTGTVGATGAAGATVEWLVSGLVAGTGYSGVVGTGGAATGTNAHAGAAGSNSTFTIGANTITAPGGLGGQIGPFTRTAGGTAANVVSSGTVVNISGGDAGTVVSGNGGAPGASSYWGGGGFSMGSSVGFPGLAPGSGGGAAGGSGSSSGPGANGIFIAKWTL